jgi:PAS domain S-box-containing protein
MRFKAQLYGKCHLDGIKAAAFGHVKPNGNHKNGADAAGKNLPKKSVIRGSGDYSRDNILWGAVPICGAVILLAIGVASHRSGMELRTVTTSFAHAQEVLEKVEQISAGLREVESSARSFAISGKQSNLDPFYLAAQTVPQDVVELKDLLHEDASQLQKVADIEPVITQHLKTMKDLVALGDKNLFRGFGQRGLIDQGNTLMEQIEATLNPLADGERAWLKGQKLAMDAQAQHITAVAVAGFIVAAVLVLICGAGAVRALHDRRKANEKLDRLLGSLPDALVIINAEGRILSSNVRTEKLFGYSDRELQGERMALLVPERLRQAQRQYYAGHFAPRGAGAPTTTIELWGLHKDGREFPIEVSTTTLATGKGTAVTSAIRDITERKQTEQHISRLNKELEDRALELESANKELEAFSYSVSHDLRSPLQNIDSFSQILMEDYANRLNAEGRDYVQRLRASCQHMEDIIEALLALSNMTRNELVVEQFDLTALAHAVAADVKQKNADRLVDWVIADGLTVEGDSQLLRVVLENLFGNAWKFTANRTRARIEFGALPQSNGARTYFVRDDGAGFDMERAGNLFTPFKRLHDQNEFRGTGIGLATVQRVINRHRGKIWAEGVVNQGATFCFTLAEQSREPNGKHHHSASPN